MSRAVLAIAIRNLPDAELAKLARGLPDTVLLGLALELAKDDAEEPTIETPAEKPRRGRKPKAAPASKASTRASNAPGESFAIVMKALADLGAKAEDGWVKCADLETATGLRPNQVRGALYRAREEHQAENNGVLAAGSRWRVQAKARSSRAKAAPKPKRAKASEDEEERRAIAEEPAPMSTLEAWTELEKCAEPEPTIPTFGEGLEEVVGHELVNAPATEPENDRSKKRPPKTTKAIVFPLPKKRSKADEHPPATPVRLEVLPVERISEGTDRFHCAPYRATLRAADCVGRQAKAHSEIPQMTRGRRAGDGKRNDVIAQRSERNAMLFSKCADCAIGKKVAEQLGRPKRKGAA